MTENREEEFLVPPEMKYDGVVREGSYLMRHLLGAWDVSLGVNVKKGTSEEDRARAEHGQVIQAITHTRNILRTLAARRDVLAESLEMVERPRIEAATEEQGR